MNPRLRAKLESLAARLGELEGLLAAEDATRDMDEFRKLSREHAEVSSVVALFQEYLQLERDAAEARDLAGDTAMKAYADEELKKARAAMERLEAELQKALLPRDPNDERNLFIEVRAGTGGDESALFAGDLFRMYTRFAERKGWQVELISESASEIGGYKEVIARIVGQGAFSKLKFESGGHRVQRVPKTEAQGRIHTSACTVAVLPEADAVNEVVLNPAELRIDTFRASGAGGQHVNKTESGVRFTHIPTGIVVASTQDRSQHRNRAIAMGMLKARLYELELKKREAVADAAEAGKTDIGWGHQIRSYVLQPYQLVKDLRTGVEKGNPAAVLDGELDEFMAAALASRVGATRSEASAAAR